MHELSVTQNILNIVVKHALANRAEKILIIHLRIGELTDLVGEYIQHYFDYLSKDTIAEGAKLKIERSPIVVQCTECKNRFPVSLKELGKIACSHCGSARITFVSGREFFIKNIEVI
jgi:hydrogenase nickel incorporation protein HypA/HybF